MSNKSKFMILKSLTANYTVGRVCTCVYLFYFWHGYKPSSREELIFYQINNVPSFKNEIIIIIKYFTSILEIKQRENNKNTEI